jgi:hypothetical protein
MTLKDILPNHYVDIMVRTTDPFGLVYWFKGEWIGAEDVS